MAVWAPLPLPQASLEMGLELGELWAERRPFVFLHPSGVPDTPRQRVFYLAQLVGYPIEAAVAVARLIS